MSIQTCKAFIELQLADYDQPPEVWSIDAMAEDLDRRLGGSDPEEMGPAEAVEFFNHWNGRVQNARGELVDYARFAFYADPGIMAVIAAGGLAGAQETFECYAALHRGKFGVEFPIWAGTF